MKEQSQLKQTSQKFYLLIMTDANEEKDYMVEFYNKWLVNPWIVLISSTNDLLAGGSSKFHRSTEWMNEWLNSIVKKINRTMHYVSTTKQYTIYQVWN